MLAGDQLLAALRRTQTQLLKAQMQLSGKSVNAPSDAPESASIILGLEQQRARRDRQLGNLTQAEGALGGVDSALGAVTDILRKAIADAQGELGSTSTAAQRQQIAVVISQQLASLLAYANQKYQSVFLFGGDGAVAGDAVMQDFAGGGIRYLGTNSNLSVDVGLAQPVGVNSNAVEAFGSMSARVRGTVDLNPLVEGARLEDLNGALGEGIRRGSIRVTVNGTAVTVDLSDADTLDDVAERITAGIRSVKLTAGSVLVGDHGLELVVNNGNAIAIADFEQGKTAADLGIAVATTLGPATVVGQDVDARLTATTPLSALAGVGDWSGLTITQGQTTKVADFSWASNVGDLMTIVEQLNLGVRLEINQEGTGLNLVSDVSGLDLTISENGGRTAEQLGLRTLGLGTKLADFNFGAGVEGLAGEDDFEIRLHDGRSFRVSVSGLETVADLLQAMRDAAAAAGVGPGEFTAELSSSGSAMVLRDLTAGAEDFQVVALTANGQKSWAAEDLGFGGTAGNAGAGDTITSEDRAKVRVESVFTHMKALQDALLNNDQRGMAFALSKLQGDLDTVVSARANAGARAAWVTKIAERLEDLKTAEETMLSNLQDTDIAEAITRYTQLMAQLEASLRVGATSAQMSLLDYLR